MAAEGTKIASSPTSLISIRRHRLRRRVTVHHRDELDRIRSSCANTRGVSVMVYDQTCASKSAGGARKTRQKKLTSRSGAARVINELVCEGCGDCNLQSNACRWSLWNRVRAQAETQSVELAQGLLVLKGFCPSFVTVEGGQVKRGNPTAGASIPSLPQPTVPSLRAKGAYGIVVTGVGGTGVVTIGQLLGMAAHLEGKGLSVLDMAGLAQKGGAVFSHVQITPTPEDLYATRIAMGEADVVLGCDLIVTASNEALSKIKAGVTKAVVNTAESPTAEFVRNPNWQFGSPNLASQIREAVNDADCAFGDAVPAPALMGDASTPPLMIGVSCQKG